MEVYLGYIIKALILPPAANLIMFALALVLLKPSRFRRFTCGFAIASLWILSTPFVVDWMTRTVETVPPYDASEVSNAEAIVILSAGRYEDAREYGGSDTIASNTLERVRYGAWLAGKTQLPLAVTGGVVLGDDAPSLGDMMAQVIREEFGLEVRWIESRSRNTAENALMLRETLPVEHVILVTHASHMPRAAKVFENAGFTVRPAPLGYTTGARTDYGIFGWIPQADVLVGARNVLHEWLGMAYYALRY